MSARGEIFKFFNVSLKEEAFRVRSAEELVSGEIPDLALGAVSDAILCRRLSSQGDGNRRC